MKRIPFLLLTLLIGLSSLPQIATAGRMYDPEISRFMSIDPILNKKMPHELQKLAGGQVYSNSPYNYTFNNPVNLVDPDGNFPIAPAIPWLIAAAKAATPYVVATAAAAAGALGFKAAAETISDYITNANAIEKQTDSQLEKSERSLENNVLEHQQKLDDYKRDPDANDNQGILKNAKSPEMREKIIKGRIEELGKQIVKNQNELKKVTDELVKRGLRE